MKDVVELRNKALALRKQRKYKEALPMFKEIWEETSESRDKWDGWNLSLCCNQTGNYREALKVSREVLNIDQNFDYGRSQFVRSILKIMEECQDKGHWSEIISLSREIDVGRLKKDPVTISVKGKSITLPSERESWYTKTSKALEKLGVWDRCLEMCQQALEEYPDHFWLKRRQAIAKAKLGDIDFGIATLKSLVIQKPEWFLYRDIALLLAEQGDYEKALDHIVEACFTSLRIPKPQNRWELYCNASELLLMLNQKELAIKHALLAFTLRVEQDWPIPSKLFELANQLGIGLKSTNDSRVMLEDLRQFWEEHKFSKLPRKAGVVKSLLSNNKAGFITCEEGMDYYFRVSSFGSSRHLLNPGLKVEFHIQESFDRVKKRKSFQAVNIAPI